MSATWLQLTLSVAVGCGAIHESPASSRSARRDDAGVPVGGAQPWSFRSLPERLTTGNLSVMLDAAGVPHVAYSTSSNSIAELRHAWLVDGKLASERVDTNGRGRRKTWVPGSLEPRLVYDHLSFSVVGFHAVRSSAEEWAVNVLEFKQPSAGISAVWQGGELKLCRMSASTEDSEGGRVWRHGLVCDSLQLSALSTRVATETVPPQLAMATDSLGALHLLYTAPADDYRAYLPSDDGLLPHTIRHVMLANDEWSELTTLSEAPGSYDGLSIAIDAADTLHVAFAELVSYNEEGDGAPSLKLHHWSRSVGSKWVGEVIPTPARARLSRGSLSLDDSGVLHLVYCLIADSPPLCNAVGYARNVRGTWQSETIQDGCESFGDDAALAATSEQAFVAYRGCNGELVLAGRRF